MKPATKLNEVKLVERIPQVGSEVRFRGWDSSHVGLYARVAHTFGRVVNVAYLAPSGAWQQADRIPFDPTATTEGSWSWPRE